VKKEYIIIGGIALFILAGVIGISYRENNTPGKLDGFAQCLKDKGAIFYGAFWCPHCQNQKKMFGRSARLLQYVECSTPNGQGQLSVCTDKKIEGYPTWEFVDGSREGGEVPLSKLAEKTSCALPQE
jgi:thiol-disulfide isomerase/thioredoxin